VDRCVAACQALARQYGADLHEQEAVVGWEAQGSGVAVRTVRGAYHAARLILTPGPWAVGLLGPFARCLTVMRQVPLWFGTGADRAFRRDQFPIYITDFAEGHFYGFPVLDGHGHKAARHYGAPELPGPDGVSREVTADDEAPVRAFLHRYLPVANGPVRRSAVCLYTLTPDRHFLVGLHPEHPQVALAAGFSGHGFKFASVMGDVLADLADRGRTGHAIEMFRPTRFLQAAGC
jgi:sarcosine oxidase